MPHVCLGTKGFALLAPAAQIKADEVFTLPQGLFACGGGSQASKGCAGAACLRAPTADVESLELQLLLGQLWGWVQIGCHWQMQLSVGMSSNQGECLCFAVLCHVRSCQHTSAHSPCQPALCQDGAQTCLARGQEISTSPERGLRLWHP